MKTTYKAGLYSLLRINDCKELRMRLSSNEARMMFKLYVALGFASVDYIEDVETFIPNTLHTNAPVKIIYQFS